MGINRMMTVAEAWKTRCRRRHRNVVLNSIEDPLHSQWLHKTELKDKVLWRGKNDIFTEKFSTKDTWNHIRTISNTVTWHRGVWFAHETPKLSFSVWLAAHDRLATGARLRQWNIGETGVCYLCNSCLESRDHLFFLCSYSSKVWETLAKGLFKQHYTTDWSQLLTFLSGHMKEKIESFLMRYTFQIFVYTIWRERNRRRHDEILSSAETLTQRIDKEVRNRITTIQRRNDLRYEACFQSWLQSRF